MNLRLSEKDTPSDRQSSSHKAGESFPGQERRHKLSGDRRGNQRAGKFDRRRNRCGGCYFFNALVLLSCTLHEQQVTEETFACLHFKAVTSH